MDTRKAIATVLAALLPLAVLVPFFGPAFWPSTPSAAPTPPSAATATRLALEPDVIVIGNSLAYRGIDEAQLEEALGLADDRLLVLHYYDTAAPTWYAVLQHHVFGPGHRPKLVVVANSLRQILSVEVPGTTARRELEGIVGSGDPVLSDKVFGAKSSRWDRLRAERSAVRQHVLNGAMGLATLPFVTSAPPPPTGEDAPPIGTGWLGLASYEANRALDVVFQTEGATDQALQVRQSVPVVSVEGPAAVEKGPVSPDRSLVPDLVALARANGANIVFARIPASPSGRAKHPEPPQAVEWEAVRLLNELGAGWLGLGHVELGEDAYVDGEHMNVEGRRTYTAALAEGLQALDALGDGPMPPAPLPFSPPASIARTGTPPAACDPGLTDDALSALGLGGISPCDGPAHADAFPLKGRGEEPVTAHWVYPGTEATFAFAPPPEEVGVETAVQVLLLDLGAGTAPPVVEANGAPVALERDGWLWRGTSGAFAAPSAWGVTVRSPADGRYLLLRSVVVTRGGSDAVLAGAPSNGTVRIRLAGARGTEGEFEAKPPATIGSAPRATGRWQWAIDLPGYDAVSTARLVAMRTRETGDKGSAAAAMASCSPVELVQRNGRAVRGDPTARAGTPRAQGFRHGDGKLEFEARNAEGMTVRLAPNHRCKTYRWLYPDDWIVLRPLALGAVLQPLRSVDLVGQVFARTPTGTVRVEVLGPGGAVHLAADVPLADLGEGVSLPLAVEVPPRPEGVEVRLSSAKDAPFVLFTQVALTSER